MSTTIRTTEMSTINCKPFKEASLSIIADGSTSAGEELQETEECISLSSDSSDEESRVAETVEEIQEAENSDDSEEPQEIHSRSERPPLSIPKSHMIAASSNPRRTALLSPYILQNQLGSRFPYHSIHGIHQRQNLNCTPYYYHGPARCGMNSPYLQPPNNFLSSSLSSSSSTSSQQKDSADAGIQPVSSFFKKTCYKCGNLGHYAENCQSTERLCYNCKEPGHETADCPHPRSTTLKQCYICREIGHLQSQCPRKSQQQHAQHAQHSAHHQHQHHQQQQQQQHAAMAHAHAHAQAQAQAQLPQRFQQQLHPNNYPPPPPYYNLQFQLSPTKQSQQYFTLSESSMTTPSSNSPYPSSSGTPLSSHQKLELGSSDPSSSLKQQSLLFLSGDALAQKYYHNQLPMNCVASPGYVYYQSYCAVGVNRSRLTSFMDNCDWNVVEASDVVCHFCQQRGHISKYCHFRAQQSSPRG